MRLIVTISFALSLVGCKTFTLTFTYPVYRNERIQYFTEGLVGVYRNPLRPHDGEFIISRDSVQIPTKELKSVIGRSGLIDSAVVLKDFYLRHNGNSIALNRRPYLTIHTGSQELDFVSKHNDRLYVNLFYGQHGWVVIQIEQLNKKVLRLAYMDRIRKDRSIEKVFKYSYINSGWLKVDSVTGDFNKLIDKGLFPNVMWQRDKQ